MRWKHRIGILSSLAGGFLLGCGVAEFVPYIHILPWLALGFMSCLVLVWPRTTPRLLLLFIIGFSGGILRWQEALRTWNIVVPYGEEVMVEGWVSEPQRSVTSGLRTVVRIES